MGQTRHCTCIECYNNKNLTTKRNCIGACSGEIKNERILSAILYWSIMFRLIKTRPPLFTRRYRIDKLLLMAETGKLGGNLLMMHRSTNVGFTLINAKRHDRAWCV